MSEAIKVNFDDNVKELAKKLLEENGYEIGDYNPHNVKAWLVQNEHTICLAIGSCEQDSIDNCVNCDLWDSLKMSVDDQKEYGENNWHDSFIHAGNASELFWFENVHIEVVI